jgi:hypothetical protein
VTIGHRTNAIYRELVGQALDLEISALKISGEKFGDRRFARAFGGDDAVVRELSALRDWNDSAQHYALGGYHDALLYAVLPNQVEAINAVHAGQAPMVFCGGRYVVRAIDVEEFVTDFISNADFLLPVEIVNRIRVIPGESLRLGDGVFGVVNGLAPHPNELRARPASRSAVVAIREITLGDEEELRRRQRHDPHGVWQELCGADLPLYCRGEVFPFWPSWLTGGAVGSEGES